MSHPPALCNVMKRIAMEAGEITLNHFDEGVGIFSESKDDGSPVTIADRTAEDHIIKELKNYFPDIPVVGEEMVSSGLIPDLNMAEYFWLVDPLDGTKEFITGSPDFTVNIALIKNSQPYLGVIYAPAHGQLFATDGEGAAIKWNEDTDTQKTIRVKKPSRNGLTVITSKNRASDEIEKYLEEYKVEKIIRKGSSLKICAVASGKADLYPGFGQTCEWDIAAGHAILMAAGGDIVALDGTPLTYGAATNKFMNPKFLARSNFSA